MELKYNILRTGVMKVAAIQPSSQRSIPDNGTKLYTDNTEKCNGGLCYIQWSRHLTTNLTVQKDAINHLII